MDQTIRISLLDELEDFGDEYILFDYDDDYSDYIPNIRQEIIRGHMYTIYHNKQSFMRTHGMNPDENFQDMYDMLSDVKQILLDNMSFKNIDPVRLIKRIKDGDVSVKAYMKILDHLLEKYIPNNKK